MPQMDYFILSSQVFWLLVKFFIFYYFILYTYIAQISEVIKFRQKLIRKYVAPSNDSVSNSNLFLSVIFKN